MDECGEGEQTTSVSIVLSTTSKERHRIQLVALFFYYPPAPQEKWTNQS